MVTAHGEVCDGEAVFVGGALFVCAVAGRKRETGGVVSSCLGPTERRGKWLQIAALMSARQAR